MIAGQTDRESRGESRGARRERGTDNRFWSHRKTVTINPGDVYVHLSTTIVIMKLSQLLARNLLIKRECFYACGCHCLVLTEKEKILPLNYWYSAINLELFLELDQWLYCILTYCALNSSVVYLFLKFLVSLFMLCYDRLSLILKN